MSSAIPHVQESKLQQPRARRRFAGRSAGEMVAGYTFVAPTTVLFTLFYFLPLIETFINSFYSFNLVAPKKTFVGMQNYREIFSNPDFRAAIWHTVVYTFFTVFFSTVIALFVAVLMNQKIRGRHIYRIIFFLPVIAPSVASLIVWSDVFYNDKTGVANQILHWFHLGPVAWLGSSHWAMFTVIFVSVWSQIGYNMVIYLAGLQGISETYYEAARMDGAGTWSMLWRLTIPLLKSTTVFVVIVGVIGAFQVFNQIYIMTQGGPLNATSVIVYYIYQAAFTNFQGGEASAISVFLFVLLFILSLLQLRITRNKSEG